MPVSGMNTSYFWICFFAILAALGCWKTIAVFVVGKLLNYYIFEHESKVPKSDFKVAIVGAGFSGIGMAIKLQKMGVEYEVFEADPEVGGTWYANKYPGCACDIQSHLYSYSFFPNALWTRKYPRQQEIQDYLKAVVDTYKLKISVNSKILSARFDDDSKTYTIEIKGGRKYIANAMISGAGALRTPIIPDFPGHEKFKGQAIHSSLWHKRIEYEGKRVAVIGTGASSVQIVPTICDVVDQITVFQRTPCWSPPKLDGEIPGWLKTVFYYIPGALYLRRLSIFLLQEFNYFAAFRTNSFLGGRVRKTLEKYHRKVVEDPETAEKLLPTFAPGCKRITPSDDYLQSFNRENVHLITESIQEFTENGIKTSDGKEHSFDLIVYATGYSPIESFRSAFDLYNGQGVRFNDIIADYPKAYLGITFPDIPNVFALLGPQTGLGHNSIIWVIECQINNIATCIRKMIENNIAQVNVRQEKLDSFYVMVNEYMKNKVFDKGCLSWYKNKDGAGMNYALWPSNLFHYWWVTNSPGLEDFKCS